MTAGPSAAAPVPVRDAAAIVLVRHGSDGPRVLMGQRGARAAFMPSKFVFPGGALDPEDASVAETLPLEPESARRLGLHADARRARGLAVTAVRELWEEAGLALGRPGEGPAAAAVPGLAERGLVPGTGALRFIFRAITPEGRPRRFDARFFLAGAEALHGDPDDLSAAGDELAHLRWLPLAEARALALPFITEIVLSEVAAILAEGRAAPRPVPFFHHDGAGSHVSLL